jgi:hypothetical protein
MSDTETVSVEVEIKGASEAAAQTDKLTASFKRLRDAKDQLSKGEGIAGGKDATEQLDKSADAADKLGKKTKEATSNLEGMAAGATKLASGFLSVGVAVSAVASAARAVDEGIKAAIDTVVSFEKEIGIAGVKMAVLQSSKREVQSAAFSKLGGNYEETAKLALKLGLNEDEVIAEAKKLLNAGFSKNEIPVLMKIKAGMDIAGQDGGALFEKLEKLRLEPKVKGKDLDSLWKLGIDSKKVYAELDRQLGGTGRALKALKAGTLDSGKVIAAVEKIAQEKYGGLADILGGSVPALLARLKGDFEHLFDGVSMAPVKEALKNVLAELEGGGGKKLKAGIEDIFGSMGIALDSLKSKGGIHKVFDDIAAAAHRAAAEIRALKPTVDALLALLAQLGKAGAKDAIEAGKRAAQEKAYEAAYEADLAAKKARIAAGKGSAADYADVINDKLMSEKEKRLKGQGLLDEASEQAKKGTPGAAAPAGNADALNTGGVDTGAALPEGMAEGMAANEGVAVAAAEALGERVLAALKAKMQVHSPSEATGEIGDYSAEGFANRMESHPGPAKAAAKMGANALGGLSGSGLASMSSGAGGGGGAAGGGAQNITFAPQISGGQHAAENKKMITALFVNEFLPMMRRAQREGGAGARV